MIWVRRVGDTEEMGNAYKVLIGMHEKKKSRSLWKENIKMDVK
jgi:hypothetical protein